MLTGNATYDQVFIRIRGVDTLINKNTVPAGNRSEPCPRTHQRIIRRRISGFHAIGTYRTFRIR